MNKPFGMMSQFRPVPGKRTLGELGPFPRSARTVGRLDEDTEGLLLLTDDGDLHHRLIDPENGHTRTYLVQVERIPGPDAIARLINGVVVAGRQTLPARCRLVEAPDLPARLPPIRYRKNVPTAWLELSIIEGKNRQVRKMAAAVGHPALRLVRVEFGPLTIVGIAPGKWRELTIGEIDALRQSLR